MISKKTENLCRVCGETKPRDRFPKGGGRTCKLCANASSRKWRKENVTKVRAYNKQWYDDHRGTETLRAIKRRGEANWRAKSPEKERARLFRGRYGPQHAAWRTQRLAAQNGRCAYCERAESEVGTLHTDHDHSFDLRNPAGWRRLLCGNCNTAYGLFREDARALSRVLEGAQADHAARKEVA